MLDIAVTETLEVVGRSYAEMVEGENARRTEILSQISAYVDAHLKDAAARDAVIAEAQRQKEEADRVTEEFRRKMESISNDHKSACDKLHGELDTARQHEENLIREYNLRLGAESDRYNELEGRYKDLMDKYVSIDREKSKEYETRIITLENDKEPRRSIWHMLISSTTGLTGFRLPYGYQLQWQCLRSAFFLGI